MVLQEVAPAVLQELTQEPPHWADPLDAMHFWVCCAQSLVATQAMQPPVPFWQTSTTPALH